MIKKLTNWKENIGLTFDGIIILTLLIGLGISIYLWKYTNYSDLGNNLVAEVIGIALAILIIERVLKIRTEIEAQQLKDKVNRLIKKEIEGILTDLIYLCQYHFVFTGEHSIEELDKMHFKFMWDKANEISNADIGILENHLLERRKILLIFAEGYDKLFRNRADTLSSYEIKYGKFLPNPILISLIDLEEHLTSLDYDFKIRKKETVFPLSEEDFVKRFAYRTKNIMKPLITLKRYTENSI